MPLASGRRKVINWRDTSPGNFILIGNRGPEEGKCEQETHITYEIHGGRKQWVGNVVFNDNHNEVLKSFLPEGKNYTFQGNSLPDNLFKDDINDGDPNDGSDCWLILVSSINAASEPTIEWD